MKNSAPVIGLILTLLIAAGSYYLGVQRGSQTIAPGNPIFDQATKAGQMATIVQIVDQAMTNPCQAINLYNRADDNNPKEVNLINVTCEGLGLPDIEAAKAETE